MTPEEQLAHLRDGAAWNLAPLRARPTPDARKRPFIAQLALPLVVGLAVAAVVTVGVTALRGGHEPIGFATATSLPTSTDTATSAPTATPSPTATSTTPPPDPSYDGIPGTPVITRLSEPLTQTFTGTHTVRLGARPPKSTGIIYNFTCLSEGTVKFPNGSSVMCTGVDVTGKPTIDGAITPYKLKAGVDTFTVTATDSAKWQIETTWVESHLSPLGVNASGQTYGSNAAGAHPDLISTYASNGKIGYTYHQKGLNSDCPLDANYQKCQEAFEESIPPTPVYASDGKTVIGHMVSSGSAHRVTGPSPTPTHTP